AQASIATTHGACAARKPRSFTRVMRLRNSTCPAASAPCTWNTCFAMSKPIVVACSMDASFGGSSTPSPWHADAVGGRPPHHPKGITSVKRTLVVDARSGQHLGLREIRRRPVGGEDACVRSFGSWSYGCGFERVDRRRLGTCSDIDRWQ